MSSMSWAGIAKRWMRRRRLSPCGRTCGRRNISGVWPRWLRDRKKWFSKLASVWKQAGGPDVPEVRLLRAGVWLRRQQYVEARAALLEFLRLAPNHPLAPLAKTTLGELSDAQPPTLE